MIVVVHLTIPSMTRPARGTLEEPGRNVSAKSGLNRSIQEQAWGLIRQQLEYKTEWAGGRLIKVDPRGTSQRCSGCGRLDGASRRGRAFNCQNCGLSMDADVNAAVNILRSGVVGGTAPPLGNRQNHSRAA